MNASEIVGEALQGQQCLVCTLCYSEYKDLGVPVSLCSNEHWTCTSCATSLANQHQPCPFCRANLIQPFQQVKLSPAFFSKLNESITSIKNKFREKMSNPYTFNPLQPEPPKQNIVSTVQNVQPKCAKNHYMRPGTVSAERAVTEKTFCDVCKRKLLAITNAFWHCALCDYDLCVYCGGFSLQTCLFGHPNYQAAFQAKINKFCDVCLDKNITAGRDCSCNFTICQKCVDRQTFLLQKR